jgi:hypothetical protein
MSSNFRVQRVNTLLYSAAICYQTISIPEGLKRLGFTLKQQQPDHRLTKVQASISAVTQICVYISGNIFPRALEHNGPDSGIMRKYSNDDYTGCLLHHVPEHGTFITYQACISQDIL